MTQTDIIEYSQSEFMRLEALIKTAWECFESECDVEKDAAASCLRAAQISMQNLRETLFTDA